MLPAYYRLTKPGIIYGNLLTAAAGFIFGSRGQYDIWACLAVLAGISLVIASACVINNYLDRHIDAKMQRTHGRALVTGSIPLNHALVFAAAMGIVGSAILVVFTPTTTVLLGVVGFVSYVGLYTFSKRFTVHSTLVGTISGAAPIAAGYTAAAGQFDVSAGILFSIMVIWQLPHFYSIAMFRSGDYAAAGLPVLPVIKGMRYTQACIILWLLALLPALAALTFGSTAGYSFLSVMLLAAAIWTGHALAGAIRRVPPATWARRVFVQSLAFLVVFCLMLSLDVWLP